MMIGRSRAWLSFRSRAPGSPRRGPAAGEGAQGACLHSLLCLAGRANNGIQLTRSLAIEEIMRRHRVLPDADITTAMCS